jgi:hypothetical protein
MTKPAVGPSKHTSTIGRVGISHLEEVEVERAPSADQYLGVAAVERCGQLVRARAAHRIGAVLLLGSAIVGTDSTAVNPERSRRRRMPSCKPALTTEPSRIISAGWVRPPRFPRLRDERGLGLRCVAQRADSRFVALSRSSIPWLVSL